MGDDENIVWRDVGFDEAGDEGTVQIDLGRVQAKLALEQGRAQPYLIVYAGNSVGRTIRVGDVLTVGRGARADLQLHGEGVSRLHARLSRVDGDVYIEDLGSTNGTHINGEKVEGRRMLKDGDQIRVGANLMLKFSLQDEAQARFQQELYEAALRDPLTKVYNRRAFDDRLEGDLSHAKRHSSALTLLLIDLDHFKSVNDTFGHIAGDYVLSEFASIVQSMVRREDIFARYGGEEFVMICRSTPLKATAMLAERIRSRIADASFAFDGRSIPVTVSIGVALARADDTTESLLERADKLLYRAKEEGRNRVVAEAG